MYYIQIIVYIYSINIDSFTLLADGIIENAVRIEGSERAFVLRFKQQKDVDGAVHYRCNEADRKNFLQTTQANQDMSYFMWLVKAYFFQIATSVLF